MKEIQPSDYQVFVAGIKEKIRQVQLKAMQAVNRELINLYTGIGQMIVEKQEDESPSIGIIICKTKRRTVVEYALKNTGSPVDIASCFDSDFINAIFEMFNELCRYLLHRYYYLQYIKAIHPVPSRYKYPNLFLSCRGFAGKPLQILLIPQTQMKHILALLLLVLPLLANGQAISYPKTLPVRSYSVGIAPGINGGKFNMDEGPGIFAIAGFPINYSYDVNFRYGWFPNGPDYFGANIKWLFREQRRQYFTASTGLHYFYDMGFDLTAIYTYTVSYSFNLAAGLDFDLSFNQDIDRYFWLPLNIGYNIDDRIYLYLEYDLPVSEMSWDILSAGATFVIR